MGNIKSDEAQEDNICAIKWRQIYEENLSSLKNMESKVEQGI